MAARQARPTRTALNDPGSSAPGLVQRHPPVLDGGLASSADWRPSGRRFGRVTNRDWARRADELAGQAYAAGEPTAWFDRLYAEGSAGIIDMPWDRTDAQPLLREWYDAWATGTRARPGLRGRVRARRGRRVPGRAGLDDHRVRPVGHRDRPGRLAVPRFGRHLSGGRPARPPDRAGRGLRSGGRDLHPAGDARSRPGPRPPAASRLCSPPAGRCWSSPSGTPGCPRRHHPSR